MWRFVLFVAGLFAVAAALVWFLWLPVPQSREVCTRWVVYQGSAGGFEAECRRWESVE